MRRTAVIALLLVLACASVALAKTTKTVSAVEKASGGLGYSKSRLTVKHGQVTLKMTNPSGNHLQHTIDIRGHGIDKHGGTANPGQSSKVSARLSKGTYTFYCRVEGHVKDGMKGKLIVQ
jgi:uncharacterized cupredoxin-like copper-binding protein